MNHSNLKIRNGKDEDSRVFTATVNGKAIAGNLIRGWSRIGGWGWEARIDGQDNTGGAQMSATMKNAVERAVACFVCGGGR